MVAGQITAGGFMAAAKKVGGIAPTNTLRADPLDNLAMPPMHPTRLCHRDEKLLFIFFISRLVLHLSKKWRRSRCARHATMSGRCESTKSLRDCQDRRDQDGEAYSQQYGLRLHQCDAEPISTCRATIITGIKPRRRRRASAAFT